MINKLDDANKKKFKDRYSVEKRIKESAEIRRKYADRIPVICEPIKKSTIVMDKVKFLVPTDLTVGQFIYVIRKRIKIRPEEAVFIFMGADNTLPLASDLISVLYEQKKDKDGFLYMVISTETTFG